jgi:hypothetical protein
MWRCLLGVLNHSGFRKAEWSVRRRGDKTNMTFAQLVWELDGTLHNGALTDPQRVAIRGGTIRAFALIFPVPSKCDPDGSTFGNRGIPFPVDPADDETAGYLLLRLEERVQPTDRRTCPLFSDCAGAPLVGTDLDRALRDALLLYDPTVAATRSWHSYRIRLASKLRAAVTSSGTPRYSDAVIQALLRWKTPSSLLIYARYDTQTHADLLASVTHLDIASVQFANLPETTENDRMDILAATADEQLSAILSGRAVSARSTAATSGLLSSPPPPHALSGAAQICRPPSAIASAPSVLQPPKRARGKRPSFKPLAPLYPLPVSPPVAPHPVRPPPSSVAFDPTLAAAASSSSLSGSAQLPMRKRPRVFPLSRPRRRKRRPSHLPAPASSHAAPSSVAQPLVSTRPPPSALSLSAHGEGEESSSESPPSPTPLHLLPSTRRTPTPRVRPPQKPRPPRPAYPLADLSLPVASVLPLSCPSRQGSPAHLPHPAVSTVPLRLQ